MQTIAKTLLLTLCLMQAASAGTAIVLSALTLDQATKQIIEQDKNKVLGAKTEVIEGKQVHVIKILTSDGRVQYLKVDADSGKLIK